MRAVRARDGFTLVELLVTLTMALIVFAGTLNALDVFSSDSQAMTQRNDAQNAARLTTDRIVRQLRNIIASSVTSPKLLERATQDDIVFQTVGTTSAQERVRYCIPADTSTGSPGDEVLIAQTQTWMGSDPGNPWAAGTCPDTRYPSVVVAGGVTNRYRGADHPAFTYNGGAAPIDLAAIDTVGLDLFVNPTPRQADAQTELRSSVFLRNQQHRPVAKFTYTPLGGGSVLLNAGTSYDPSGQGLAYSWSCNGTTLSTAAVFSWHPGPGTYTVTLNVTDQAGLQAQPQVEQVTVA